MDINIIDEKEYIDILKNNFDYIPIWCGIEALSCYEEKEIIKVTYKNNIQAIFLMPLNNNGVRRKYRFFPYVMPLIIGKKNNVQIKNIYKAIFNYIFNKYDYTFIPIHPDFKNISSICSQGGFVEMRHTHVFNNKINFNDLNSKLKNHINHAKEEVEIVIDNDYSDYNFDLAIKGSLDEVKERTINTKNIIDNNNGIVIKAKYKDEVIAGLIVIFDKEWSYLLHSYQNGKIRGVVPYMIYEASKYIFDELKLKYFDLEGSVIDDIDDFFASFDANVTTYPYIIQSKNIDKFNSLVQRSINIDGRVKYLNETN